MKKIYLTIILTCITVLIYGQQIKSYDLDVSIDVPTKKIKVEGSINIDFENQEHISTVMWKNTIIHAIKVNNSPVSYSFETSKPSPIIFIDEGRGLIISNPSTKPGIVSLYVNYEADFTGMETSAESFTDDYLQIGFYNAWLPVDLKSKKTTSKIRLSINKDYKVSGSGLVKKKGAIWEITQPWNAYDNVIIASKNLKTTQVKKGNTTIETVYTSFPKKDINSIIETSQSVLDYFGEIYPKQDEAYIKFVVKHSASGGGYNRKNFISLRIKEYGLSTQKTIAHEVAHFWATGADSTTWEDWLNESFAEYSALLYIRDRIGKEEFNTMIKKNKEYAKNTPPIWGFNRSGNNAYRVLYLKGALILNELYNKIGSRKFIEILKLKANKETNNTNDFLNMLEQQTSKRTRNWLENALKS